MRLKQIIGISLMAVTLVSWGRAQTRRPARGVKHVNTATTKPTPTPTPVAAPTPSPKELAEAAAASRAKLMEASQTYRESLERLLALQKQDETKATELVAKRKQLLEAGVIAKREVEESETALQEIQKKTAETEQRVNEVEQLVAEVTAAEQLANQPAQDTEQEPVNIARPRVLLVRYTGRHVWALTEAYAKADAFFRLQYKHALPVSAFGQTETHNRLGFDHSNSLDVAVHPDSPEGQALQGYLRAEGISFIAIRGAIAGSATGAHIHIGAPSKRLGF